MILVLYLILIFLRNKLTAKYTHTNFFNENLLQVKLKQVLYKTKNIEKKKKVNCKLHSWNLGLIRFYTSKFQKLDLTPWSLVVLAIHPPRLISAVKWHIFMVMCFIFDKSASKLRCFSDDQAKSWHASRLRSFKAKLKTKTST